MQASCINYTYEYEYNYYYEYNYECEYEYSDVSGLVADHVRGLHDPGDAASSQHAHRYDG